MVNKMSNFSLQSLILGAVFATNCVILNASMLDVNVPDVFSMMADDASTKELCMEDLGCFSITEDFKNLRYRPFNVLPNHRVVINTKFNLYTVASPMESYRLKANEENIKKSAFNPSHPTKFIVHGFMDHTLYGPWMEELKTEFLLSGPKNVIIVDWSGGNMLPYYQASANTRVVGAEIAHLIKTLQKTVGLRAEDCHILGHSLGSHAAGYAGERLKTLGRITGLDPAEPYFQNMPPSIRLDPTDAEFVDVIHSDSDSIALLGFGMSQLCGHVDFFPNNGRSQPGCHTDRIISFFFHGLAEGIRRFVACNHQRAVDFYMHSINYRSVPQVSYSCHDWEDFLEGGCTSCGVNGTKCAILGERAIEFKPHKEDNKNSKLYLKTSGSKPFWISHYEVTIKLFKPKGGARDQKGTLKLRLTGDKSDEVFTLTTSTKHLYHGSTYTFLVTTPKKIGKIQMASLDWKSSFLHNLVLSRDLYVEYVKISPMAIISKEERKREEKVFCDNPEKPIKNRETRHFTKTKC